MAEEEVRCLPQLVEIPFTIPPQTSCSGTYRVETPLLISTWEPGTVVTVTAINLACNGSSAVVNGTAVDITFGGEDTSEACNTPYLHDGVWTALCDDTTTDSNTTPNCPTTGRPLAVASLAKVDGFLNIALTTTSSSGVGNGCFSFVCGNNGTTNFTGYEITNIRKVNPADPDCPEPTNTITIRYEGCSKAPPPGSYPPPPESPPPGGTPGGTFFGGGSPPPPGESPNPPALPLSGGGGGGGGGGGSTPPPASPATQSPPIVSFGTSNGSGVQLSYPSGSVLTPAPIPQFPSITVLLPGGEFDNIPWNGYVVFPGSDGAAQGIVVGATYPAYYQSPMLSQKAFHNWKTLKHILLQFDNRRGVDIQTQYTTLDVGQHGKALQKFNANVGIVYNDELSDQVIQDLYRYDTNLWSSQIYLKHYSPKQLDNVVSFKESLLGTSYSYQIAVYSSDTATWKLVGWQVEGRLKGKRKAHSRD